MSELLFNLVIILLSVMPGWGLALSNLRSSTLEALSVIAAAAAGAAGYILLVAYGRNLFLFYAATYTLSVIALRSIGAGLLTTSATVGFWEIPAQVYRYLGWWDPAEFSGWLWCIYSATIVLSLLYATHTPLKRAAPPILLSVAFNAAVLILYPTLQLYADNVWYIPRSATVLVLIGSVYKYGAKV